MVVLPGVVVLPGALFLQLRCRGGRDEGEAGRLADCARKEPGGGIDTVGGYRFPRRGMCGKGPAVSRNERKRPTGRRRRLQRRFAKPPADDSGKKIRRLLTWKASRRRRGFPYCPLG